MLYFIASTRIDRHNSVMTLQALEGMAEHFNGPRKPAMRVQHDRTVPPMGATVAAKIQRAVDGHHELYAECDIFPDPVAVTLPDGTEALEQHSEKERYAFTTATMDIPDTIAVAVDYMNFQSHEALQQFFAELHNELDEPFLEEQFGRKALISDPELLITLGLKAAALWLAVRASGGLAAAVTDITKEETKKLYYTVRSMIFRYASFANPKNRPITYVLRVPGKPNIEFVARSTDVNKVVTAFTDGSFSSVYDQVETLRDKLGPEFIQFILNEDGTWHFNYLLTHDGSTIGIKEAFDRRAVLLNEIARVAKHKSGQNAASNMSNHTTAPAQEKHRGIDGQDLLRGQ
jgi:hypothetical protein